MNSNMSAVKNIMLSLVLMSVMNLAIAQTESGPLFLSKEYNPTSWGDNRLPKECGLKLSKEFGGITFTGRYASYTHADTWYLTYGADGAMYSSYTDGSVNGQPGWNPNPRCAKVVGYNPLDLKVSVVGERIVHSGESGPGGKFNFGRYPAAQLIYNGVWYYGTYLLESTDHSLHIDNQDWQVLQPFIGFRVSGDYGKSWYDATEPNRPMLENAHNKWVNDFNVAFNPYEVMIGAPHFVDFGENLEYAPTDEATQRKWAYMVAHGADAGCELAHNSWVSGDNVYLLRILMPEGVDVEANFNYINNPENWQYLAKDGSYKKWNRGNLQEVYSNIKPIVDATGYLGNVGLTYNAPLGKYIMTLSRMGGLRDYFDTLILEADAIDGEYRVVQYMKGFATVSYFMNIPSRFISDDGKSMWLCYSSNYTYRNSPVPTIGGSSYALCLTEFILDGKNCAAPRKYEAEGMRRLGGARIKVDNTNSNGAAVTNIARVGDGVEFCSKGAGNAQAVVSSRSRSLNQMSVYVNGKFRGHFTLRPAQQIQDVSLCYLPVRINRGDKVRLSIECSDMERNRSYVDNIYASDIDYVVVDNITPCLKQEKGSAVGDYVAECNHSKQHTLLVRYKSNSECKSHNIRVAVNGHDALECELPAVEREGVVMTKPLRLALQKGENTITLIPTPGLELLDVAFSEHIFNMAANLELKPHEDGSFDACDMLHDGTHVTQVHAGYTGRGFVAGLDAARRVASVSFIPMVQGGDYKLTIRYSAGELKGTTLTDKRLLELSVGGNTSVIEFPLTDSWTHWREVTVPVHLSKGDMITLKAHLKGDVDDCINIDRFVLK